MNGLRQRLQRRGVLGRVGGRISGQGMGQGMQPMVQGRGQGAGTDTALHLGAVRGIQTLRRVGMDPGGGIGAGLFDQGLDVIDHQLEHVPG